MIPIMAGPRNGEQAIRHHQFPDMSQPVNLRVPWWIPMSTPTKSVTVSEVQDNPVSSRQSRKVPVFAQGVTSNSFKY